MVISCSIALADVGLGFYCWRTVLYAFLAFRDTLCVRVLLHHSIEVKISTCDRKQQRPGIMVMDERIKLSSHG